MQNADGHKRALALWYTKDVPAPLLVAKGQGQLAERIVEVAKRNGIPVQQDLALSSELMDLRIGQEIPERCFEVIAALYRFVYEQRSKFTGN